MKVTFSSFLGILTLLVTFVASVPAFLALNKNEPILYYSIENKALPFGHIEAIKEFREFLMQKQIPPENLELKFRNVGNAAAKEINLLVTIPGYIVKWEYKPSRNEMPPWVDLPANSDFGFKSTINRKNDLITKFAADNTLTLNIGYIEKESANPTVEIYYDGIKANLITDVSKAPRYSPFKVLQLPAIIFITGLSITFLCVIISFLVSHEKYRKELSKILKEIIYSFIKNFG